MTINKNNYVYHTYPNKLRLITVPMESTGTVTVLVLVRTGSRYETKKINGISHFLEHLMFKGTEKRPGALEISEELDSMGAEYNAFTSKEYTGYYVKCAASKFDNALDIISDIFQNSKFDPKEIDKERGAVKEEINMYMDTPSRYVSTVFEELVYGDHPLGWDIAGPKGNIDSITREEIIEYFETNYVAQDTVISVAGNVKADDVKEKVGKYFDNIRENEVTEPQSYSASQKEPGIRLFHKETDQTHVNIGFRAYNKFDPQFEAQELLSIILGGGMSSRLFVEVREKRGLAYRIGTGVSSYNEVGDFTTYAGLSNDKLIPALEIILDEHRKLRDDLVSDKELTKAKDYIQGKFAIGLESSDSQASYYGDQELLEKKLVLPEERMAQLLKVTSKEMQKVAQEIYTSKNLNIALVGPFKDEKAIRKITEKWTKEL